MWWLSVILIVLIVWVLVAGLKAADVERKLHDQAERRRLLRELDRLARGDD